ncbi:hypothetical protein GGF41_002859 [Coemansia sp. RSA 2531]|nr:hypothetical protein GGF41_002859 [Coemansia sp. RSA 2531]
MPSPVALAGAANHASRAESGGEQAKPSQPPTGVAAPSVGTVLCGVCGHGFPDRLQLWEHIHHCDYTGE